MYISKIRLKNIRCCEDLTIDFAKKGASLLISGDNGDGKSTVLRSVAMALCDLTSSSALFRELPGDLINRNRKKEGGKIEIEFFSNRSKDSFRIVTKISSLKAFEVVYQELFKGKKKITDDEFPWDKIFVTGYGAGLRTSGTHDYQDYLPVDAMYPLFKYDMPLQNPELIFRRILDEARKKGRKDSKKGQQYADEMEEYITHLLKGILNLERRDRILLTKVGIEVKSSRWRGKSRLKELGDGHISITNMFFDLISWWMLYLEGENIYENRDISGVVLIDEVEQHLHPQWQVKIMQVLSEAFPKIQFISTTHSPLVISGAKNIPVLQLYHGRHDIRNVRGWLAEDIYREIMGLKTTRPNYVEDKIQRYQKLHLKSIRDRATSADLMDLRKLKKELLEELPSNDPVVLTAELANLTASVP